MEVIILRLKDRKELQFGDKTPFVKGVREGELASIHSVITRPNGQHILKVNFQPSEIDSWQLYNPDVLGCEILEVSND